MNPLTEKPEDQLSGKRQPGNFSYLVKSIVLIGMTVLLFISTLFIRDLISERQNKKEEAEHFFETSWGAPQTITGPYISIPYKVVLGNKEVETRYIHLMPHQYIVKNNLKTEKRNLGIFEVSVYKDVIRSEGYFDLKDLDKINIPGSARLDEAIINYGVSDMRGLEQLERFIINGQALETQSGVSSKDLSGQGFSAPVSLDNNSRITFEIDLSLRGTNQISFIPVGYNTTIDMTSDWDAPGCWGKYIPNEKPQVNSSGFNAHWKIQHLNRSFPQVWMNQEYDVSTDKFGVDLKIMVNNYVKSERTVKYALLVIGLVFVVFFFIETLSNRNIHPLQYLLTGAALCLFYGLLVSISEFLDFNRAYWIAAGMTVLLISIYIRSVLGQMRFAVITGSALTGVYAFLYIILLQEDYALLIGNIGLFVILGLIMYFSRKIKWNAPASA